MGMTETHAGPDNEVAARALSDELADKGFLLTSAEVQSFSSRVRRSGSLSAFRSSAKL